MSAGPAHSYLRRFAELSRGGLTGVSGPANSIVRRSDRAAMSFLIVAAAVLTLLTCTGWLDPYADAINRANSLLREGKYEEAIRLYENSVVERPDDLTGRLNSAIALYAAGRLEDSSSRFEEVLERIAGRRAEYPAETAGLIERIARYGAGSTEFRLGFAAESLSGLATGSQIPSPGSRAPQSGVTPQSSDLTAAAVTHYRRAVRHFGEALCLDPHDDDARHNYRLAYARLSRLEQLLEQGEQGDGQGEDAEADGSPSDEGRSEQDRTRQEEPSSEDQEEQDLDVQNDQEQESTKPQQGWDGEQERASMSREEALRLLEMMSDEEVHGVLMKQEHSEESVDYLDW
jgi:tetratricopeptide (TPR) repeat protein